MKIKQLILATIESYFVKYEYNQQPFIMIMGEDKCSKNRNSWLYSIYCTIKSIFYIVWWLDLSSAPNRFQVIK